MKIGLTYDLRQDYLLNGMSEEETAEFDKADTIEAIENALVKRLDLLIEYANAQAGTSRRVITPRYVREHRGYIYLIAYCHQKKAQRTFRLDRIRRVIIARER